jgi:hypothetical protein
MSECGQRATLVVTRSIEGTATNVARRRIELCCRLPPAHDGPHYDEANDERWQGKAGERQTLLLHEDDDRGEVL